MATLTKEDVVSTDELAARGRCLLNFADVREEEDPPATAADVAGLVEATESLRRVIAASIRQRGDRDELRRLALSSALRRRLSDSVRRPVVVRRTPGRASTPSTRRGSRSGLRQDGGSRRSSGDDEPPLAAALDPLAPRPCVCCGEQFKPPRSTSAYCQNEACRRAATAERVRRHRHHAVSETGAAPDPYRAAVEKALRARALTGDEALDLLARGVDEARQRLLAVAPARLRADVELLFAEAA